MDGCTQVDEFECGHDFSVREFRRGSYDRHNPLLLQRNGRGKVHGYRLCPLGPFAPEPSSSTPARSLPSRRGWCSP